MTTDHSTNNSTASTASTASGVVLHAVDQAAPAGETVLVPDEVADLLAEAFAASGPAWSWQDDAICAQVGGDLWFPERGEPTHEAKRLCGWCPVRTQCLDYAMTHDERFGVWGGLSERERRRLRRETNRLGTVAAAEAS